MYASKCTVQYKNRESAVAAMLELEKNRYLNGATVPFAVNLADEVYSSGPEKEKASNGKERPKFEKAPEVPVEQVPIPRIEAIPQEEKKDNVGTTGEQNANGEAGQAMTGQPIVFIEYFTNEGNPYYYNTINGQTQWEAPPNNAVIVKPNFEPKNLPGYVQSMPANTKTINMPKFTLKKGPPGCNVFIYHLPHEWTEQDVYLHFSPFGNMVSARVIVDPITKLPKGYGIFLNIY